MGTPKLIQNEIENNFATLTKARDLLVKLNNTQNYLCTGSCPESVRDELEDMQCTIISELDMMLIFLQDN